MSLDELEKELYRKDSDIAEKRKLKDPEPKAHPEASGQWQEPPRRIDEGRVPIDMGGEVEKTLGKTRRWWRPVMIISAVVFSIAIVVSAFFIYQSLTARGINIEISSPERVKIGEPINVVVSINDNSSSALNNAKLSLNIPEGAVIVGKTKDVLNETRPLGTIESRAFKKETFQIMLLGGDNEIKRITATLTYGATAIGTQLEKSAERDIVADGEAINIDLLTPNKVFSSENFDMTLSYKNVSATNFEKIKIQAAYPPTFNFKSSSIKPTEGTTVWEITNLTPGSSGKIVIQGSIIGQDQSFFDVKFIVTETLAGQDYEISEKTSNLAISSSPLALSIFVNEGKDYIAKPGESLSYTIQYANNTRVGLQDVVLKVQLSGEMFDFSNVTTNGFVTSNNKTITWNAANNPSFRVLDPDTNGNVNFRISTKATYPIKKINDKNFSLKVDGQIESPTVPNLVGAERTVGIASLTTKLTGQISIDAQVLFQDLASGITNKGPIPPRVDQPTQYTVHWIIRNSSTDVSSVDVRAFLLAGVRWTGQVRSSIDAKPEYNERTQEVVWKIPKIVATQGIISKPVEAIFQIEATPSEHLVNLPMPLMGKTTIRAFDEFIQTNIGSEDNELSTDVSRDDSSVGPGQGTVQP